MHGHNYQLPSKYTFYDFSNQILLCGQIFLFLAYVPVIVKVYVYSEISFVTMQPFLYAPFIVTYTYQVIKEIWQTRSPNQAGLLVQDKTLLKSHKNNIMKLNMSLLPNWLIVTGFVYVFSYLLCARLDGITQMSFFIVLIPCWLLLLYVCSYMILVGLASNNSKVNKGERLILSLFVPLGFLTSTVLAVCYADGYLKSIKLGYLFLPQLASFLGAYLYARCLVRPSGGRIQNEPTGRR